MTTTSMVLMAWLAGTVAHAGQPQYKLTVYLLDKANDGYMTCIPAETLAGRMFAAIGISLEWAKGKPADESSQPPIIIEVVTEDARRISCPVHWRMPYPTRVLTLLCSSIALSKCALQVTCWPM